MYTYSYKVHLLYKYVYILLRRVPAQADKTNMMTAVLKLAFIVKHISFTAT